LVRFVKLLTVLVLWSCPTLIWGGQSGFEAISLLDFGDGTKLVSSLVSGSEKPQDRLDQPTLPEEKSKEKAELSEIDRLKVGIIEQQNKAKLGFRKALPCSSVEGYGVYSPLEGGSGTNKIIFYIEPANVSTLIANDRYIIDLSLDLSISTASGKVLAGKEGIGKINKISRSPTMDVFFRIQMNLGKPINEPIIIKAVLHDKIKNGSATATFKMSPTGTKSRDPV
jgi:hypothetical protein